MAEEVAKEGPSSEEGQVLAKKDDEGGKEEGEVVTVAESPESALALNVDGLRFWLKEVLLAGCQSSWSHCSGTTLPYLDTVCEQAPALHCAGRAPRVSVDLVIKWCFQVLLDNLKLEKELKLSKQARLLAAQVCRIGTPFLAQSAKLPTSASAQAPPKGKKTKKRRMVEVRHADSVPRQEVPQTDVVAKDGEAQPCTAAGSALNGTAEAPVNGVPAEQQHHKPVTPGQVNKKRGRDAEFDVQHESKLDNGLHPAALGSQVPAL